MDGKSLPAWLDPERVDSLSEERLSRGCGRTVTDIGTNWCRTSLVSVSRRVAVGSVAGISLCGTLRTAQLERVVRRIFDAAR